MNKKICKTGGIVGYERATCMHFGHYSSGSECAHGEGQCDKQQTICNHGHEINKCNVCRDRFEVRIVEEGRSIPQIMVQMTRNGCQWQSIGCDNKKELVALRNKINEYLSKL